MQRSAQPHTGQATRPAQRPFYACFLIAMLIGGLLVAAPPPPGYSAALAQQDGPMARVAEWVLTSVTDWQQGSVSGLLITNNDGGELRLISDLSLEGGPSEGVFLSDPYSTTFTINAAGAFWRAELPPGTDISLELRGRSSPPAGDTADEAGWGPWHPLVAGDARSRASDGAFATPDVLEFPPDTLYLQVRATFRSSVLRASAVLNELTVVFMDTTEGPPTSPALPRVPISLESDTLTPAPSFVPRSIWSAREIASYPNRMPPRGIILHQIDVDPAASDTLPLLRALAAYQIDVLGWEDLSYHYVIDEAGTLYEGRLGGPTAAVTRLSGGDTAIHIALIGDLDEPPSPAAQRTLTALLAWLGQAYALPPAGEHPVLVDSTTVVRPNIAAHNDVAPGAPDPGEPLKELLPELRTRADEATIRGRWYVAEGNTQDYVQQLAFFNPSAETANATVLLFADNATEPITRSVALTAGGRTSLIVNDIAGNQTNLSWVVEANEPLITERSIGLSSDIDTRPVSDHLSRAWYFAEGSTSNSFETYLVLFNPQDTLTEAVITYMRGDGSQAEQRIPLQSRQRLAIRVADVLPNTGFGIRIVAGQPIIAERTMRFGAGGSGMHSSPGISELSRQWYFAEGTTQAPFEMRLLLLNPNRQAAIASVTYMTPDGTSLTRRYAIPPTTRLAVNVNEVVPELGVATLVESDRPLAVERALYITTGGPVAETEVFTSTEALLQAVPSLVGTVSFGATAPAYSWRFADGRVADANHYLLLSNPSRGQARVSVEFVLPDGSRSEETVVMPAESRYTLPVSDIFAGIPVVSAVVRSTQPIVAERSIFPTSGVGTGGGSTSLGVPGE